MSPTTIVEWRTSPYEKMDKGHLSFRRQNGYEREENHRNESEGSNQARLIRIPHFSFASSTCGLRMTSKLKSVISSEYTPVERDKLC